VPPWYAEEFGPAGAGCFYALGGRLRLAAYTGDRARSGPTVPRRFQAAPAGNLSTQGIAWRPLPWGSVLLRPLGGRAGRSRPESAAGPLARNELGLPYKPPTLDVLPKRRSIRPCRAEFFGIPRRHRNLRVLVW